MSKPEDYSAPLERAIQEMRDQMAKPENIAKSSWLESTPRWLAVKLADNLRSLLESVEAGDAGGVHRRAANVANFAWMLADHTEHHQAKR